MFEALTYQEMLKDINRNIERYGVLDDTIGILITRPDLVTGKSILNSLEYFHFRTGKMVNFYLPGYGAYWPQDEYPDGKVVTRIDNVDWSFSNKMFAQFINDLEDFSKWKYSGESELLLVELKNGILSYENMMQFYLDNMLRDNVILSVHQFFEKLFRICQDKDTINQISNVMILDKAKQISMEKLIQKLPMGMGQIFTQKKYFSVRNMKRH
ncbi:MAG: hypothetical protein HDR06_02800 [Lachnospiraceae bacterium]|nr:hypothetical protein [Lachnospiraceae bacterium]